MCAIKEGFARSWIVVLVLIIVACSPAHAPAQVSPSAEAKRSAVPEFASKPASKPPPQPSVPKPRIAPCAIGSPKRSPTARLTKSWNRFHAWLERRGYHHRSYANSRQFTTRVGDAIRSRLRRTHPGKRIRTFRLAMMLLGLRARTVRGSGSRWDCTFTTGGSGAGPPAQ